MGKYVYTVYEDNKFDLSNIFSDPIKAIELAMYGYEVAVLDAQTYQFQGYIN